MRLQTERCCEMDDCACEVKRKPPNAEQLHFLRSIARRCEEEAADLNRPGAKFGSEPMRCGLFGLPGAGKTECIKLQKRFFEECLGWEAGVQYQCVAPQNTMAALLGGSTCHTWAQVPLNPSDALASRSSKKTSGDIDDVFLRCQSLRWLIIDEINPLACSAACTVGLGCLAF